MCSLWIVNYKHKFTIAINFFLYYWPFLYLFWISSPLNDIKYQLCYLKRCLYTQKFYLFIVTSFLLLLVLFLCLLKIVYYCLWGINEFVVFLCIVHVWFWFFILLPRFLSLVIKGQFFPRTDVYIGTHQSTRTCQKTCLSVFPYIFQAKYIRNKKINENKLVGGTTTWGTIWGSVYEHLWINALKIKIPHSQNFF
jgi:hypothetical protein